MTYARLFPAMMVALAIGLAAAPACSPVPPATVSNATTLDERSAIAVEKGYKAARVAVNLALDFGVLKPETPAAQRVAELDARAYAAVLAARKAYEAANATDYAQAIDDASGAVDALTVAIERERK